jgi:hypothetical protein
MAANFEVSWFSGCFNNSRLKAGHSNAESVDHATEPKRNMVGIHYQTQTIWVNYDISLNLKCWAIWG